MVMRSSPMPTGDNQIPPVDGLVSCRWPAPVRMTRPSSLPATVRHNSTFCGAITGVSLAGCDRNSAKIADHPRPAEDPMSIEVGYFLAPCVCNSICQPNGTGVNPSPSAATSGLSPKAIGALPVLHGLDRAVL